jgi:hypothetical protein
MSEAARQQALLHSLWARDAGTSLQGWLREPAASLRGWQAYQANAGAAAERALAARFPTVQQLVGDEAFAALARALWHAHPPARGDLAHFGDALPAFIAQSAQLADVPYLADVARLDAALAACESAADATPEPHTVALLGESDLATLHIVLTPGTQVAESAWPIVTLWHAHHRAAGDDPFAPVREALHPPQAECALVSRQGWRAEPMHISPATARFTQALLAGHSLARALNSAGDGFDFEAWLIAALTHGHLQCVRVGTVPG